MSPVVAPAEQFPVQTETTLFFELQFASPSPDIEQVYGKSMNIMLNAGHAALEGEIEFGTGWQREVLGNSEILRLKDEFVTAVNEMVKTADGVGEYVAIERDDSFCIKDGRAIAMNGEPIADLISRGAARSRQIANESNSCYDIQADRDEADLLLLTDFVEPMFSGANHNFVLAISPLPEDGISRDGDKFWQGLGYNTEFECAMAQLYFAEPDGTLSTKVLSIDKSNVAGLAAKLRQNGVDVPEDVTPSELILYPITGNMEYQEVCELMEVFVSEYEEAAGLPPKITTTKELVEQQSALTNQAFEELYLPVAMSLASGTKTADTTKFVKAIQPATSRMSQDNALAIREVNNKSNFDKDDAVAMHGAVLYSLAETLRAHIVKDQQPKIDASRTYTYQPFVPQQSYQNGFFIEMMGGNFNKGVSAGRTYGGCGAHIDFGESLNPQESFGGKSNSSQDEDGPDGKGPLEFKCKNNHTVRRPYGGYADHCPKCRESDKDRGKSVRC